MSAQAAVVEVLTAEVRVLMVGSRQVTLSVYNQLDEVSFMHVEPFGRVNPRAADASFLYVVGRDDQGALVRSRLPVPQAMEPLREQGTPSMSGGIVYWEWQRRLSDSAIFEMALEAACEWADLPLIVLAGLR